MGKKTKRYIHILSVSVDDPIYTDIIRFSKYYDISLSQTLRILLKRGIEIER